MLSGRTGGSIVTDTAAVKIEQVSKSFGSVRAVRELDLVVPRGCVYGILGPNGAGKTTAIRMMMDIIAPDTGRIEVFGSDDLTAVKARIGYLPEERGLYRKMRVGDTLRYLGSIKGMTGARLKRLVPERLEQVELGEWISARVEELSKGMQQKLQFLAATICDPELLILDEPFAGLDPVNVEVLTQEVRRLQDQGCTILLSTHMMAQAERLCDSVMLVHQGLKVLDGRVADILGRYDPRKVILQTQEASPDVAGFPMVEAVASQDLCMEVTLVEGSDPQDLLAETIKRYVVLRFEIKRPTLNEVFLARVSEST